MPSPSPSPWGSKQADADAFSKGARSNGPSLSEGWENIKRAASGLVGGASANDAQKEALRRRKEALDTGGE